MKSAHVYIWYLKSQRALLSGRTGDVAKISCEFCVDYRNDDFFNGEVAVPMKACGVHVTYNSQSDSDEERLPPTKKQKNEGRSKQNESNKSDDDIICHPLQLKFIGRSKQKHLPYIQFL
ncbi:uncharacterized protein LOC129287937 [Prosopis cineraria]|uniref:uncharacterized protein LOC129287937 n=1 Tax=Prosopis cineraria TaxID=364024 RepID=UPI0024102446|nr:uncharacterized protein LOC129287937 [Prosopis cineraria]